MRNCTGHCPFTCCLQHRLIRNQKVPNRLKAITIEICCFELRLMKLQRNVTLWNHESAEQSIINLPLLYALGQHRNRKQFNLLSNWALVIVDKTHRWLKGNDEKFARDISCWKCEVDESNHYNYKIQLRVERATKKQIKQFKLISSLRLWCLLLLPHLRLHFFAFRRQIAETLKRISSVEWYFAVLILPSAFKTNSKVKSIAANCLDAHSKDCQRNFNR